jgi:general secretion pathway protein M
MNTSLPTGRAGHALAVGLLLLLLAVIWVAVANPLIGWYEARAEAIAQRAMFAQRMSDLVAELPALEQASRHMVKAAPARNVLLQGATDAIAGAALQQRLQVMATATGATLSSVETLTPRKDGDYQRIRLRVAISGSWPVLVHLLQMIAVNRPRMLVDDLRLSQSAMLIQPTAQLDALFTVIAFRAGTVHPAVSKPGIRPVTVQ